MDACMLYASDEGVSGISKLLTADLLHSTRVLLVEVLPLWQVLAIGIVSQ